MLSRILIVEDDPLVAMMLEGYLEALDRETAGSAEDVAGALAAVAECKFDAAIIDVHLANGETSEPVAAALKAADIPFIICTGSGVNADPSYAGAPFLTKPVTLTRLEEALSSLSSLVGPS
jgi:CheY-like chemotaxis protein